MSGPPISFESLQQRITRLRRFGGPCRGPPSLLRTCNSASRVCGVFGGPCRGPPSLLRTCNSASRVCGVFGGPFRGPPSLLRACNSASRLGPQIAPARLENREHRRPRGLRSQDAPAEADHAPAAGARGVDLAVIEPALGADEHDGAARTLRVRRRGAERRRVAFPETER